MLDALGIGVGGGVIAIVIAGAVGWAWRQRRPSRLERNVDDVKRALKELQESAVAPPLGTAPVDTDALAAQATGRTERLLAEAVALQSQHKEREAIECLLEAYRRDLPPDAKMQLHVLAGNGFLRLAELDEAEDHYRQALDTAKASGDPYPEAVVLGNLGIVYTDRGKLDAAEKYYNKALVIDKEIGNRLGQAHCIGNLGLVYRRRGELDKAEEQHQTALAILVEMGNRFGQGTQLG
jgi:tetratricopeptide (TPR) repeat protein